MSRYKEDFITNSSSSSFIVLLWDKPTSVKEMKKILFYEGQELYENPYIFSDEDPAGYPVDVVAEIVFGDMKEPIGEKEFVEELTSGSCELIPDRPYFWNDEDGLTLEQKREKWRKEQEEDEEYAKTVYNRYATTYPNHKMFVFEYSDNDGKLQTAMENGDLFQNVPHIKISKH